MNLNYTIAFVPDNSWNMFTQSTNLKMPTSLQPPSLVEKKKTGASTCAPESSSCSKFMRITQYQRPSTSPPPPPKSPFGPVPSSRPSPAECLRSSSTPLPRSTSPCLAKRLCIRFKKNYYGKRSSSSTPTSPASSSLVRHVKRIGSYPCSEKSLCNKFWNMMDNKRSSLSPPIPHIPVVSWLKSPPSLSLASS